MIPADANAAECKGTKQWYQGQCRYPDTISRLQAEAARQQAAAADAAACTKAKELDSLEGWKGYSEAHPKGACQEEAQQRIAQLEAELAEPDVPDADPKAEPTPEAGKVPSEPADQSISPFAWVGFGVGAAGLITWGVAGGISMSRTSELEDACPGDRCPPSQQAALDDANLAADVATAGVVVSAVGTAFGVLALLAFGSDDENEQEAEPSDTVVVQPVVGAWTVGLAGRF